MTFEYPVTYPEWWLDSYYIVTWSLGMLLLAVGWGVFFRWGKFSYGIDLGCIWKSTLLLLMTTAALGAPNYYNTRFVAEHGQEGDRIVLEGDRFSYDFRNGGQKEFRIADIARVYKEPVTFNPPPKYFIVAETGGVKDSVFVTENLPGYEEMLKKVSELSGTTFER